MDKNLNSITLVGNVERAVEFGETINFRLVSKETLKDVSNQERVEQLSHHVVCCPRNIVNGAVSNGVKVFVDGQIVKEVVNDGDGFDIIRSEIMANTVEVLGDD